MGVAGGSEHGVMAQDFLHLQKIDTGLNQMGCIAVAPAVRGELFFGPHCSVTLGMVFCTPPRSRGVDALRAPAKMIVVTPAMLLDAVQRSMMAERLII